MAGTCDPRMLPSGPRKESCTLVLARTRSSSEYGCCVCTQALYTRTCSHSIGLCSELRSCREWTPTSWLEGQIRSHALNASSWRPSSNLNPIEAMCLFMMSAGTALVSMSANISEVWRLPSLTRLLPTTSCTHRKTVSMCFTLPSPRREPMLIAVVASSKHCGTTLTLRSAQSE